MIALGWTSVEGWMKLGIASAVALISLEQSESASASASTITNQKEYN